MVLASTGVACNRCEVSRNEESKILPPMMSDSGRPPRSRAVLGALIALLAVAVLLALWALIFNQGDSTASADEGPEALPTPITLATSTPVPAATPIVSPTPAVAPTPLATGLQSCADENLPLTTTTYTVDTNTTPLNQRVEPSVEAEQIGSFDAGQASLVFTGECVVNATDGFTWWQIFNGTNDVWVASDFVTVN